MCLFGGVQSTLNGAFFVALGHEINPIVGVGFHVCLMATYFVTICTFGRMPILSYVLNDAADSQIVLTEIGHEINKSIQILTKTM